MPGDSERQAADESAAAGRVLVHAAAKTAVLVLGMHRSGTSALTRLFSLLGADLPKNPTIYWESEDLVINHDQMLASAGSNWHDWRAFNPDWSASPTAEPFKQKMLGLLERDFAASPLFVLKDPRICRLVPVWLEVLDRFGAVAVAIMPLRNPLEVAASLQKRDGFSLAKSYLLWLRHVLDAEAETRELPRAFVNYEDVLDDWRGAVTAVSARTGLHWPRRSDPAAAEIDRFLAAELRHHTAAPAQLAARADIAGWIKESYAALRRMAAGSDDAEARATLDKIRTAFDAAASAFGLLLAGEAEDSRAKLSAAEAAAKAKDDEMARLAGELPELKAQLATTTEALAQARNEAAAMRDEAARHAQELQQERERVTAELDTIKPALDELPQVKAQLALSEEVLAQTRHEISAVREEASHHVEARNALAAELEAAKPALAELPELKAQLATTTEALAQARNETAAMRDEAARHAQELQQERERVTAELDTIKPALDELPRVKAQLALSEEALAQTRHEIAAVRDEAGRTVQDRDRLAAELEAAKPALAELPHIRAQLAAAEETLTQARNELAAARDDASRAGGERERLGAELQTVTVTLAERQAVVARLTGELDAAGAATARAEAERDAARQYLRESQAEVQRLAGEFDAAREEAARAAQQRQHEQQQFQRERERLAGKIVVVTGELTTVRSRVKTLEAEVDTLGRAAAALQAARDGHRSALAAFDAAQSAAARHEARAASLAAELDAAREVLADHDRAAAELSAGLAAARDVAAYRERRMQELSRDVEAAQAHVTRADAEIARLTGEMVETRRRLGESETKAKDAAAAFSRDLALSRALLGELEATVAMQARHLAGNATGAMPGKTNGILPRSAGEGDRAKRGGGGRNGAPPARGFWRALAARLFGTASIDRPEDGGGSADHLSPGGSGRAQQVRPEAAGPMTSSSAGEAGLTARLAPPHPPRTFGARLPLPRGERGRAKRAKAARAWEHEAIRTSRLFDAVWYLKRNPDVAEADADPLWHYLLHGAAEGREPHPLFDTAFYRAQAADLAASGMTPLGHYVSLGVARGLDPHPLFDTDWYLQQNPDVAAARLNPLYHFYKIGGALGLDPHPLFDSSWYLEQNPDVARLKDNPLHHYVVHGAKEGRDPSPLFDSKWYTMKNPSVAESRENPLVHFLAQKSP